MNNSSIEKSAKVRPAAAADLSAVAEIYAHYVENSVSTFELRSPDVREWTNRFASIVDAGLPFLIAEIDGCPAGYAYCAPWKSRPAYRATAEDSIYLAPWATGRGLGGVLLDELLAAGTDRGLREIIAVIADTGSPASITLHSGHGFTEVGRLRRVGFKHNRWIDTVLMQRSLVVERAE
ncbi:N-acetyltransferase family protein [Nocardia colli]|uniref:N-acetyltransferase family protein n=1 Tax=Nocardia colli TaxID=2545717 RepID=A0A5N0E9X9_9NOCA|nr:GNAT family N-acetyltransferase [Nocardia colli]KAA8886238.1 N-acetyltransferase family protein [Nocardia colli]